MPMIVLLAAAAATVVPMVPTSKWNVDYGETACLLGRIYGTGKTETVMGLRAIPLATSFDLVISTRSNDSVFRLGQETIAVEGAGPGEHGGVDESRFESFPTRSAGTRQTRMSIDSALFEDLQPNAVLRVTPDKGTGWAFAMPNAKAAFAALAKCNDATLKQWGLDPTERDRIAIPPEPASNRGAWVVADDYPRDVLRKGAQGTSVILWTIGLDGRVADCRTVVTSGEPELDKAACRALTARGRYTPAMGQDGKPMISHSARKVVWVLPGTWQGKR